MALRYREGVGDVIEKRKKQSGDLRNEENEAMSKDYKRFLWIGILGSLLFVGKAIAIERSNVKYVSTPPTIDGKMDLQWEDVTPLIIDGERDGQGWFSPEETIQYEDPSHAKIRFLWGSDYNKKLSGTRTTYLYGYIEVPDKYIESAAWLPNSDNFTLRAHGHKTGKITTFRLTANGTTTECMGNDDVMKIASITGTFDNSFDVDEGYSMEFAIPLKYAVAYDDYGGIREEDIEVNISIIDHDKNPGGTWNSTSTQFRKFWWGDDADVTIHNLHLSFLADEYYLEELSHCFEGYADCNDMVRVYDNGIYPDLGWYMGLAAGTGVHQGGMLIHSPNNGGTWTMYVDGFNNFGVRCLEVFHNSLFAGTGGSHTGTFDVPYYANVYRIYKDGSNVGTETVLNAGTESAILDLVEFKDKLYAFTGEGSNEAQVWQTTNATGTTWEKVFIGTGTNILWDLCVFDGKIWVGGGNGVVYYSDNGSSWSTDGTITNTIIYNFASSGNTLYIGGTEFSGSKYYAVIEKEWHRNL